MAADPVSRPGQLQMRDIAFAAQILHLKELKQNDTSFNRTAVKEHLKFLLPKIAVSRLSEFRQNLKRAKIVEASGLLDPGRGERTFLMAVGPAFDQTRPDAMMTCRMGYCRAFEMLGIPYRLVDVRDVAQIARQVPSPFIMYFAGDISFLPGNQISFLRTIPSAIWVYPWFEGSHNFFLSRGLNPETWTLTRAVVSKVLALEPRFGFTSTVRSGLDFFESWERSGLRVHSYPLACDTFVYKPDVPTIDDFVGVELAFVGGYWQSKGVQIDAYLRPFEDRLRVYGYSPWPYRGYSGLLNTEQEASLYRQARVCPVVNEPTVALLKGQINERVFKVFGSGGCAVVDAVPAYRELFSEDELLIAENPSHFGELIRFLLSDKEMNNTYRARGLAATLARHTYVHRAKEMLRNLGLKAYSTKGEAQLLN